MTSRLAVLSTGFLLFLSVAPARADNLTGADNFVCSATTLTVCVNDGTCVEGLPAELNIPAFVEIDLKQKRLSTTKASGENRMTPIDHVLREGGRIVLQGHENGRAYSYVISETTGAASAAIATDDGATIAVFGACTPMVAAR